LENELSDAARPRAINVRAGLLAKLAKARALTLLLSGAAPWAPPRGVGRGFDARALAAREGSEFGKTWP
jgi:hypothetical protein